ncbi:hypothetical protein [Agromyces subbeticus]|uniref:hypothetical protein n=1 Tax=Agromyces subbeticus TaxID=293890 RepID=UPI0003B31784|nr:hypothetical protein [Agromyces subbeticus]
MNVTTVVKSVEIPGVGRVTCMGEETRRADDTIEVTAMQTAVINGRPANKSERAYAAEVLGWFDE